MSNLIDYIRENQQTNISFVCCRIPRDTYTGNFWFRLFVNGERWEIPAGISARTTRLGHVATVHACGMSAGVSLASSFGYWLKKHGISRECIGKFSVDGEELSYYLEV